MLLVRKCQITMVLLTVTLASTACIPIVIRPGTTGPVREWPASATCPVPARAAGHATKLLELMNEERSRVGLAPLVLSPAISAVSQAFACENAARQEIGHEGSDGSSLSERLRRGGISASMVAENNASFYKTPEAAMAAWMASAHHRENILRPNARAVGVGLADGAEAVWVVNFTS
jgi:uncharacterized protein YkwD